MIKRAFQQRTGRVISLCRLVLAAVFFLAMWIDPSQPAQHADYAYPIVGIYVIISAILVLSTWSNWWVEHRCARWSHSLDILIYTVSVYFTEAYTSNFTSPFFTFFAFLVFSATVRWGWQASVLTAGAATALYLLAGIAAANFGMDEFDPYRFGRRASYLLILSLVLIWFGINQQGASRHIGRPKELEHMSDDDVPPIGVAARYAAERTGAARVLFAWWEHEEPWIKVTELDKGQISEERFGPSEFVAIMASDLNAEPVLFDMERNRALVLGDSSTLTAQKVDQPLDVDFARRLKIHGGLRIPVRSVDYGGELFALDIPGVSVDDLRTGREVGHEISSALDRYSMMVVTEQAAVAHARLTIARDLHDTVVQVLAGASFRLEALRSWVRAGRDPEPEISAIQDALSNEQKSMRRLIARLRGGRDSAHNADIRASLEGLMPILSRQWGIDCHFVAHEGTLEEPAFLEHELHQIVREAVANAVRHGKSTSVGVDLSWNDDEIRLIIQDNGTGFSATGNSSGDEQPRLKTRPWSIHERTKNYGGTLSLYSSESGSSLTIVFPREEHQ